jgi:hypothetical protein
MKLIPDHLAVNGTTYAVMQVHTEFGKHISVKDTRLRNVPDSCGLYYVLNDELLNGLVLGHASGAVCAANRLHVVLALFCTTIIPPFFGPLGSADHREHLLDISDTTIHEFFH